VTISTFGKRRFSRQKARKYTWRIKKNKYIDSELYTQRSGLINVPNLNNNVPGGLFLQNIPDECLDYIITTFLQPRPKLSPKLELCPPTFLTLSPPKNDNMAEPPSKRHRPDSRQMWDASDRQAPLPSRERDEHPPSRDRPRRDDRDRDRDRRRYRSRSPRESAGRGDRGDYRRGDRDDRSYRDNRGRGNRRGETFTSEELCFRERDGSNVHSRIGDRGRDSRDYRDRPRERSRDRDAERTRRHTRSRSPQREKGRDGGRDRDRDGERNRDFERDIPRGLKHDGADDLPSRSATPVSFKVGGTPQPHESERMDVDGVGGQSKGKSGSKRGKKNKVEEEPIEDEDIVVEDDGLAAMQAMMGFGGFGTTHQKKVAGNDVYAVRKEKKTEYRQYMNRVGGFNRPLSPGRD
jgi:U4/U6.U5 tri-snRNP-associated protein 3